MLQGENRAYFAGFALAILFGCSFLAAKIALAAYGQSMMLALRFSLAAIVLWGLALTGVVPASFKGKPWWVLVGLSVIYPTISFNLEAAGVDLLPSSQAGIIMSLSPVIALVLGRIFLHERATGLQLLMVAICTLGVVFTSVQVGESGGTLAGILFMLGAATCAGVQTIIVRRTASMFSAFETTCVMSLIAAIAFDIRVLWDIFGAGVYDAQTIGATILNPTGFLAVAYLAVGCSVGAFFFLNYVNGHLPVARAALFTNLSTVVSCLVGIFVGDPLTPIRALGMVLIIVGVWGVNRFGVEASS